MKNITTTKKIMTSIILSLTLVTVMGITVFAAARNYRGFSSSGVNAMGWIEATWQTGRDNVNAGTDTTSVTSAALKKKYKIGVRCSAYKNGKLLDGRGSNAVVTSSGTKVSTAMFISADKFTSIHNITTSSGAVQNSISLVEVD